MERGPDWLLVKVKSVDSDADSPPGLADGLWELMQRHLTHRLVLELDQIAVLNSRLIGQLVKLYSRIRQQDGVMRLCGLSPYNLKVLRTCRLDERFLPYRNRAEAVMAGCVPHRPR
ncbi:MAG: STAS domain-containing protein [Pirellulales bacterium]|nr:STAS domain-containing protein [Pirellulales bacterium]